MLVQIHIHVDYMQTMDRERAAVVLGTSLNIHFILGVEDECALLTDWNTT